MSTHHIDVEWKHDLTFDAHQEGRTYEMVSSTKQDHTGKAISPKQMLLTALAGCTAMDVVSLMEKMRVPFTTFVVKVTGQLTDEHPKAYSSMHVTYEVDAPPESIPQIERAVELSETRYCGVSDMLRKAATITHEIKLV